MAEYCYRLNRRFHEKERHPSYITQYYDDVVQKMLGCGKEDGGYSEYLSARCGKDFRRVCFTCKSCFCLSCSKGCTDDFVAEVSRVLQPGVRYRHMILTSVGINEETGKWVELRYFPYEIIRKKWRRHLFKMLKETVPTDEMKSLIDALCKKYPRGLVAHVTKGKVPEQCRGRK